MSDVTTDPIYDDIVRADLDLDYVRFQGEEIRSRLFPEPREDGRTPVAMPVGLAFEPSNGSRYELVFVPLAAVQQVSASPVPSGAFKGGDALAGRVLVSRVGGPSWPLNLAFGERAFASYVGEKLAPDSFGDAVALCALLRAISGVEITDAES